MNELPNELICMIFRHLDLMDLFFNCRLVNKRWSKLVDTMKFQELIILNTTCINKPLSFVPKSINLNNILFNEDLFEVLKIKFHNLSGLKFLKLKRINGFCFANEFESLNKFIQLEHLIIDDIRFSFEKDSYLLCLPNLKKIVLNIIFGYQIHNYEYLDKTERTGKLLIDAIQLERVELVRCLNLDIEFVHPKSIKILIGLSEKKDLKVFSNLEVLKIPPRGIYMNDEFNLFSRLPNGLKELHFDYTSYVKSDLERVTKFLKDLLDEKVRLKLDLNLYVNEIKLISYESILKFCQFENYLDDCKKVTYFSNSIIVDPNKTIKFFKELSDDFCIQFPNINSIKIQNGDQEINQDQIIRFLNGCSNLQSLTIKEDQNKCPEPFDQQFYDQLPQIAWSLYFLKIYHFKPKELRINFEFVSKFIVLQFFETNGMYPLEDAKSFVRDNCFLHSLRLSNIIIREFDDEISVDFLEDKDYETC